MCSHFAVTTIISTVTAFANAGIAYWAFRSYASVRRIGETNIAILNRDAISVTINPSRQPNGWNAAFSIKQPGVRFDITSISLCRYDLDHDGSHISSAVSNTLPFARVIVKGAENYFDLPLALDLRQRDIVTFMGTLNGVPFSISCAV